MFWRNGVPFKKICFLAYLAIHENLQKKAFSEFLNFDPVMSFEMTFLRKKVRKTRHKSTWSPSRHTSVNFVISGSWPPTQNTSTEWLRRAHLIEKQTMHMHNQEQWWKNLPSEMTRIHTEQKLNEKILFCVYSTSDVTVNTRQGVTGPTGTVQLGSAQRLATTVGFLLVGGKQQQHQTSGRNILKTAKNININ